jgi:hypothetical protein
LFKKYFLTRIGIRSEDLNDFLEKTIRGSGISLSSPRLVIPAAIYGLWALSHQYFSIDWFDFQVNLGNIKHVYKKHTFLRDLGCMQMQSKNHAFMQSGHY